MDCPRMWQDDMVRRGASICTADRWISMCLVAAQLAVHLPLPASSSNGLGWFVMTPSATFPACPPSSHSIRGHSGGEEGNLFLLNTNLHPSRLPVMFTRTLWCFHTNNRQQTSQDVGLPCGIWGYRQLLLDYRSGVPCKHISHLWRHME